MRKRIAALLLVLLCLVSSAAIMDEMVFLPQGIWSLAGEGDWRFMLTEGVYLTDAQQEEAAGLGLSLSDGRLLIGTSLTREALALLYPGAEDLLSPPLLEPELARFELTGEWYYDEDGILYYRHGDGYRAMTVNEVFAALATEENPDAAAGKTIYLTIDDAPSPLTMDLLATLDALDVKATFFVVGAYVRELPVFLRAIYDQGHVIANHSYSHNAEILSGSFSACLNDFRRAERAVAEALGFELSMPILRVPYGVTTIPDAFRASLQEQGYLWIDWNALNGDTESSVTTDEAALQRALATAGRQEGDIVLLVHDNKKRTIRTLPALVAHFRAEGYTFRALDIETIGEIPGVRMGLPVQ